MDYELAKKKFYLELCNSMERALKSRGWRTGVFGRPEDAKEAILMEIPEGASVGIPGSVTARQLGLIDALKQRARVLEHWTSPDTADEMRIMETRADVFISSANAASLTGEIVVLDATGNRIVGSTLGPKKIIFLLSANKIERDLNSALQRAWWKAVEINAIRLGADPKSILNFTLILHGPPRKAESLVVLIADEMGY